MRSLVRRAAAWTLVLAGLSASPPAPAHAQVRYGSIVVEARDASGSPAPGADVTITETGTNLSRSGVTNNAGVVTFATVPPGKYSVRVNLTGFKEFVTTDVAVSEDGVMRVSSQLEVGQVTETVTVSGAAAILQTDRAEVRTDIPAVQLENLPVPVGRNYQNLFVTVPGISPPENMHSVAVNPARGLAFSSNGTTRNANSIRIEGAISNNLWLPHVAAYVPALEAIESVGVTTSTFDADQGLSGGMSANVLIKSGTNLFRGSAFEYFYDEALKSRPYFLPATEKKPEASQHQFGGTLGGPIVRNKAFFFGSYQGTFDRQLANRFGTVPTAAMRNGDFSASPTPIYDPATGAANGSGRTAFAGNIIPRERFDPIVQKLIAGLPLPNLPGLSDNYFATGDYTFDRHNVDAKVNYNPTTKLGIVGRVGWLGYEFRNPPMFGDLGGLPVNSTAAKAGTGLGDTYTFTGSALVRLLADVPGRYLRRRDDDRGDVGARSAGREPRARLSRDPRHERQQPPLRRLASLQHHQLLEHRLRRQQPLALHRRQLAGAVHGQRDMDERGAHAEVRRRHRPSGDESSRARRWLRKLHVRRRADADPGWTGRKPVQHHRRIPARAAHGHFEERDSLRERLHAEPQLAIQLLRARPVAAHAPADGLAGPALRPLPDGDANDPRVSSATIPTRTRCSSAVSGRCRPTAATTWAPGTGRHAWGWPIA